MRAEAGDTQLAGLPSGNGLRGSDPAERRHRVGGHRDHHVHRLGTAFEDRPRPLPHLGQIEIRGDVGRPVQHGCGGDARDPEALHLTAVRGEQIPGPGVLDQTVGVDGPLPSGDPTIVVRVVPVQRIESRWVAPELDAR